MIESFLKIRRILAVFVIPPTDKEDGDVHTRLLQFLPGIRPEVGSNALWPVMRLTRAVRKPIVGGRIEVAHRDHIPSASAIGKRGKHCLESSTQPPSARQGNVVTISQDQPITHEKKCMISICQPSAYRINHRLVEKSKPEPPILAPRPSCSNYVQEHKPKFTKTCGGHPPSNLTQSVRSRFYTTSLLKRHPPHRSLARVGLAVELSCSRKSQVTHTTKITRDKANNTRNHHVRTSNSLGSEGLFEFPGRALPSLRRAAAAPPGFLHGVPFLASRGPRLRDRGADETLCRALPWRSSAHTRHRQRSGDAQGGTESIRLTPRRVSAARDERLFGCTAGRGPLL
mmetsp:Transcript_13195/g.33681  ORF Transcript_13195/g.33681 Transcript_13195/m.33681 type:complete len:342 (+) Transcript_13195:377-1402(+)